MPKINVAIDGPSGAGKSTVSQEVAKRHQYTFINTGSVYRALALYTKNQNLDWSNEEQISTNLVHGIIEIDPYENVFLEGENVTKMLRQDDISKGASAIAQYPRVREFVVELIQNMANKDKGYIMDGRDTTFKILPNAELKIFLTASPEERARRRMLQNAEMGFNDDYKTVLSEIIKRDYQDMNRKTDPLHKVADAIEIDCTNLNFEQVVAQILELIKERENNA